MWFGTEVLRSSLFWDVKQCRLVITNFFMEDFERALEQATQYSQWWFHYADDTSVIWPHGTSWKDFWTTEPKIATIIF
jgi:hypothetical protein